MSQSPTTETIPSPSAADPSAAQQVRVRLDDRQLTSAYANAYRTNLTMEEVVIDFGLNLTSPSREEGAPPEVTLRFNDRIVMNYRTAKRLARTLGQVIAQHEQRFGEIQMAPADRK